MIILDIIAPVHPWTRDISTSMYKIAPVHLDNCVLRCSRSLFQTRFYPVHPWTRTARQG